MKHISIAMSNLNLDQEVNSEQISLLENILRETRNPKIAAVLALDLMLVGVDTVSFPYVIYSFLYFSPPPIFFLSFSFDFLAQLL